MPDPESTLSEGVLDRRYTVPEHVVHRSFAAETVVLNLRTGGYYGLNRVAGRMLEVIATTGDPREAVQRVLEEWTVDRARVERDATALCTDLLARGLIEHLTADGDRGPR